MIDNTTLAADDKTIDGQMTEVKPDNALVMLDPQRFATELFAPYGTQLASAKRRAARTTFDVTTKDGKATVRDIIKTFVKIRTGSEKAKTEAKRPIDQAGRAILAVVAPIKAGCEAEEDKYQRILTDQLLIEENERQHALYLERERVEAIERRVDALRMIARDMVNQSAAAIQAATTELVQRRLDPAEYQEYLEDAILAQNTTITALESLHRQALQREEADRIAAENARELARMRADQAERDRVAAEERAERERQAQAEQAAQAERERAFAEQQAAVQRQQQQMHEIMGIQNLGSSAASLTGRYAVELALQKVHQLNPNHYGDMKPMAEMVRSAAMAALDARLAEIPEPYIVPAPEPVAEESPSAPQPVAEEASALTRFDPLGLGEGRPAAPAPRARPAAHVLVRAVAIHCECSDRLAAQWLRELDADELALVA